VQRSVRVVLPGAPCDVAVLTHRATAGGSAADDVVLAGVPAAALELEPCAAGVIVSAAVAGARAGGHPLAAGARRLLRPGERVTLHGATLELLAEAQPAAEGTRVAAAALVRAAALGAAPIVGPHLVVLNGAAAGARFPLGPVQVIGRGRGADIRLPDPQASRRHARLRVDGRAVTLEDLGAKNGLRVNGVPVERRPSPLRDGDELALGDTLLAVAIPGPSAPVAAAPQRAAEAPWLRPTRPARRPAALAAATLLALCAAALALAGS
jgi:hypothetical protein